jgi:hypothetical protein
MAKRGDEWFPLSRALVAYDHARDAPLDDVITLDFINADLDPAARAGIELTRETAEEAEVRGQGRRARRALGEERRVNGRIASYVAAPPTAQREVIKGRAWPRPPPV